MKSKGGVKSSLLEKAHLMGDLALCGAHFEGHSKGRFEDGREEEEGKKKSPFKVGVGLDGMRVEFTFTR
jgi:hypothetical protein